MDFGTVLIFIIAFFGLYTAIFFMMTLYENKSRMRNPKTSDYPTVTVAIPAFNEEKTIAKTIESVLALEYPRDKLTIVVVDDGSRDRTYEVAKAYEESGVLVLKKENGGKASALNLALKKTDTMLFGSLDADSFVQKDALKRMVGYFKDPQIMAVTPSLKVYKPKNILQKVQYIEYLIGVFLRKMFAFLDSIHVTPGPFTIYRKEFFTKYGYYDEKNLTEDIEIALRIQKNDFGIENSADASVYTVSPSKFRPLLKQRLRWYIGFTENVITYRSLFSRRYGDLGIFILPASFISVLLVIISIFYTLWRLGVKTFEHYLNWKAVNFDFWKIQWWTFDPFYINLNAVMILSIISIIIGVLIIIFAKRISKEDVKIKGFYIMYLVVYWILFGFWWLVSGIYALLGKRVSWGQRSFK